VVWLLALGVYYILQFRIIAILVYVLELPIGSASIICLEQVIISIGFFKMYITLFSDKTFDENSCLRKK